MFTSIHCTCYYSNWFYLNERTTKRARSNANANPSRRIQFYRYDGPYSNVYHFTLNRDSELDKIEASVKNSKEEITWNASYNYQNHLYYYNNEEPGVEISGDKYFDHIFDLIKEGQTLEGDKVLINKDKMKDILSVSNIPYMLDKDNKMEITVDEDITMEFDIDKDNNLLRGMKCYFTINGGIPVSFNYSFEIPNN